MSNLKTTLEQIKKHSPCGGRWDKLTTALKRSTGFLTLQEILHSNGVKDTYWALRCWPVETYAIVRAQVAESVYHIWHTKHPNDTTIRACIDGWYALAKREINVVQMKALQKAAHASAAGAFDSAAYYAYDSASDSYAAYYAAYYAAASVSASASYDSAASDAVYYYYYDSSSFPNIAREKQWEKNREILEEFIQQEE